MGHSEYLDGCLECFLGVVSVKHHPGEGNSLLFEGIEALGTQFPGVHRPAGVGIGRIQRVCLMQTRFRLPQQPPWQGGCCPAPLG